MTNKNKNKNKNENNMNNSKEETEGRDTPLSLYSAIVGGEGQDFVATTLSTSAQVCVTRYKRERFRFHFPISPDFQSCCLSLCSLFLSLALVR